MMSKKGGFGKFLGGLAVGAGIGLLFAPDTGSNTRKVLKKKLDELLVKLQEVDLDEVKDEMMFRIETLQAELSALDKEKAKDLALKQAKAIKEKAEELYKYAIEKGTPIVEKSADEVRKQALKVVKEIQTKLEETPKKATK
ncbi:MAG: YtxH domain-containing protein [Tenericutes bacterium]|nr:YtxH domain-containing protein [Mycoplasmatota bacterium]